jgi:cytoskeletal protein CcmA (bactofilin family)
MNSAEGSTVIGKSVTIRGELSGNEDLYVDGDVEGTITLAEQSLTIGPNAKVRADVHARDVIVFGAMHGDVHATGRVEIRGSATVHGDVYGGKLSIEENATIKGKVSLGGGGKESASVEKAHQESLLLDTKA